MNARDMTEPNDCDVTHRRIGVACVFEANILRKTPVVMPGNGEDCPDLLFRVPPSTSPVSRDFRPREYWRGPVWPVMTWLFSWAYGQRGWVERSLALRAEGLRQASDGTFAEYFEPFTGEPLGSMQQSWTAAAVLDWLGLP